MNLKFRLVFIILLSISNYLTAFTEPINLFTLKDSEHRSLPIEEAQLLQLNQEFLTLLDKDNFQEISVSIPDHLGQWMEVTLQEQNILAPNFEVRIKNGSKVNYTPGRFFTGKLKGKKGWISLSYIDSEIAAIISIQNVGNLNVMALKDNEKEYIIYNDADYEGDFSFTCNASDSNTEIVEVGSVSNRSMDPCIKVYLEADYQLFQDKGDAAGAADFLTQVFGPINTLYAEEGINIQISGIEVWDSPDPYSKDNPATALAQFLNLSSSFEGDVAHLVSTNTNNIGGLAYIDALCTNTAFGYSNISRNFNDLPNYSWTVNVIAHEIGHNLGSPHTHSCLWPNGPLDNCADPEGPCSPGPQPQNGGTIMSYCQLTDSGINFANGFGQLPGDLIRDRVFNSVCLSPCDSDPIIDVPNADFTFEILDECADGLVLFSDNSDGEVSEYLWTFEGAGIASSTEATPLVNYPDPGIYSVTLTVTNNGESDTYIREDIIQILDSPEINYSYDFVDGTSQVQFSASSNEVDAWFWDFGDGNVSTLQNPMHEYAELGDYNVTLSAENSCGQTQMVFELGMTSAPTASIGSNTKTGCVPFEIQFFDISSHSPSQFSWTFEGGNPSTSTEKNPIISYNQSGTFDVILRVSNGIGTDEIIMSNYVEAQNGSTVDFDYTQNNSIINFENNAENFTNVFWDFGDGNTSSQFNPSHTYEEDGNYLVTLTALSLCGTNELTQEVFVDSDANPSIFAPVTEGCQDIIIEFENTSTNANSVIWIFEGGNPSTSTANNPVVQYSNLGTFDVSLQAFNEEGSVTTVFEDYISIFDEPQVTFNYANEGLSYVFSEQADFASSYFWDFGDGTTSELPNPFHTYLGEGSYDVSLTITNDCGTATHTETVDLFSAPSAELQITDTRYCVDQEFQLFSNSSFNTATHYWELLGPTSYRSEDEDPFFTVDIPGDYTLTYAAINPVASDTIEFPQFIQIVGMPVSEFQTAIDLLEVRLKNLSTDAESFVWDFGDGNTSNEENPIHQYDENGEYTITLSSFTSCGVSTFETTIVLDQQTSAAFQSENRKVCVGDTVDFVNLSNEASLGFEWHVPGAIPPITTDVDPSFVFEESGSYNVTLIAFNELAQDTFLYEDYIQVDDQPVAGLDTFAFSTTSIIFNSDEPALGTYFWEFGDGTNSTISSPSHDFPGEGSYEVYVYFENTCGFTEEYLNLDLYTEPVASFELSSFRFCAPQEITITNQSSENTTDWFWKIEGSEEGTLNEYEPTFHFENPGLYDVELIAVNPIGADTILIHRAIEVALPPDIQVLTEVNGATVNFENFTAWTDSFAWDFGDGNTSTAINASHSYEEEGVYEVTVIGDNFCGVDTMTMEISAFTPTTASFFSNVTESCAPVNIQFDNASSSNAFEFEWFFENGIPSTSTQRSPSIRYESPGFHDVRLIAKNAENTDTILLEDYIFIRPFPEALFEASQNGLSYQFTNNSVIANAYSWDFGDGTNSTEYQPYHTFPQAGIYTVVLTAFNDCGEDRFASQIIVTDVPGVSFSSDRTGVCTENLVQFFNLSDEQHTEFQWFFEGGIPTFTMEESPSIQYNTPGSYDVQLIAKSEIGTDTILLFDYIKVRGLPNANFTVTSEGNQAIVENQVEESTSYVWQSDGFTYQGNNPILTYRENGVYDIDMIAFNECGNDTTSSQVFITAFPSASGDFPPLICADDEVYLMDHSTNQTSIEWLVSGGTFGEPFNNVTPIVFQNAGIYDVVLVAKNQWGTDSLFFDQKIEVLGQPVANFDVSIFDNQMFFSDLSSYAQNYTWDFGDGTSSVIAGDVFHTYVENGIYSVSQTINNSCGQDIIKKQVDVNNIISSTEDLSLDETMLIDVFPNPFEEKLKLLIKSSSNKITQISIYDILGQIVYAKNNTDFSEREIEINLEHLSSGSYVVRLETENGIFVEKIVKR